MAAAAILNSLVEAKGYTDSEVIMLLKAIYDAEYYSSQQRTTLIGAIVDEASKRHRRPDPTAHYNPLAVYRHVAADLFSRDIQHEDAPRWSNEDWRIKV